MVFLFFDFLSRAVQHIRVRELVLGFGGLGFRVQGLGHRVHDMGFVVELVLAVGFGLGLRVRGSRQDVGYGGLGVGSKGVDVRVQSLGFRVWDLGFGILGLGFGF